MRLKELKDCPDYLALPRIFQIGGGGPALQISHELAARLMLRLQNLHQVRQFAGLLKPGEKVILFIFFVIILDEPVDQGGNLGQGGQGKFRAAL